MARQDAVGLVCLVGEHVRHRKAIALIERQATHPLLVVGGLARDGLDLQQLGDAGIALSDMCEDPRAVARAARTCVDREETQVEQVGEGEGEGEGDDAAGACLARGQGRIRPRVEGHPGLAGGSQEIAHRDLFLGREGTLVDLPDLVANRSLVGHGQGSEVCHGITVAAGVLCSCSSGTQSLGKVSGTSGDTAGQSGNNRGAIRGHCERALCCAHCSSARLAGHRETRVRMKRA